MFEKGKSQRGQIKASVRVALNIHRITCTQMIGLIIIHTEEVSNKTDAY